MASVSTQTDVCAGFFVIVCGAKKGPSNEKYELPLNSDGNLKLETLRLTFPGVSAVQYKNPESGIMRILKEEKGLITPPPEGWGKTEFSICQPPDNKRPATETPPTQAPPSKVGRPLLSTPGGGVPPPALMDLNGGAAPPPPQGHQQQLFGIGGPPQQQMMNGNNGFNGPMMDFQNDDFGMQGSQFTVNGQGMDSGAMAKNGPYPLQCDLCKVTMNGQNQAQLHFEGRRHKEAILHTQGAPNTVMEPEGPYGGMMGPPPMMMNDMMPPMTVGGPGMMGPSMAVGGPGMMGPPMGADPYFGGGEYYDNQMMFNAGPPRGGRGRSFINVARRSRGNGRGGVLRGGRSGFGVRGSPAKRARGKNGSFQNDDMSGFQQF